MLNRWCGIALCCVDPPRDNNNKKRPKISLFHRPDGYTMLMSSDKVETAVYGCHFPGNMAVRMREVLARPWVGEYVPPALCSSPYASTQKLEK